jgi:hypothetical protein
LFYKRKTSDQRNYFSFTFNGLSGYNRGVHHGPVLSGQGRFWGLFVVAHWPVNGAQRAMLGSFMTTSLSKISLLELI